MRHAALRNGGLSVFKDISHSSHRLDQRLLTGAIHLAAQPVNMNIHYVRVRLDAHSPDLVQDHRTCHNAPRISAQVFQEHKLLLRQLQNLATARSLPAQQVQFKIENMQARRFACLRAIALQQVAQPRQQFCQCKRFGQVVIAALFQPADAIVY